MPHALADWSDRDTVMQRLSTTLPVARMLAAYWIDDTTVPIPNDEWIAEPPFPPPETKDYHRYSGPGPLFVDVNPHSVRIRTGRRWRGFLSIQPLRSIHLQAFFTVANAFNANVARCFPDNDFAIEAFWDGGDFNACCAILDGRFGDAVPMVDAADPILAAETDIGCPLLQYSLTLQ